MKPVAALFAVAVFVAITCSVDAATYPGSYGYGGYYGGLVQNVTKNSTANVTTIFNNIQRALNAGNNVVPALSVGLVLAALVQLLF